MFVQSDDSICSHVFIGATTVGTGGDWSPQLLGWGQQCIGPPNFLAVVFKKPEILRTREPTNKHSSHQNAGFIIIIIIT